MSLKIPYGKQSINLKDIRYLNKVLKSELITQGPIVNKFEKKISKYTKSKFSVAYNSGSSALTAACHSLGLKEKDILWTCPNTYVASSNCGLHCGATIDFVDIDENTHNISVDLLLKKLKKSKIEKKLPKIIVVVHFAGLPCDMKEIYDLSRKYKFKIIEDASHALGSKYMNEKIGSCKFSDATVFSFHPVKIITTAEGGMVTCNNVSTYNNLRKFRENGITRELSNKKKFVKGNWFYEQHTLGHNFRLSELHSALGLSQSDRIDSFIKKRNNIANRYRKNLCNLPINFQEISNHKYSSYHLFVIRVPKLSNKVNRHALYNFLRKKGIFVNVHYIPVHLHPFYMSLGFKKNQFSISEKYYSEAISLPIFPDLKVREQMFVISQIKNFFK